MKKTFILLSIILFSSFATAEGWGDWQNTSLAFKSGDDVTSAGEGSTHYRISDDGATMEIDIKALLQNEVYNNAGKISQLSGSYMTGEYDISLDLLSLALAEVAGYAVENKSSGLGRMLKGYEVQYVDALAEEANGDDTDLPCNVVTTFKAKFADVSKVNLVFADEPKDFVISKTTVHSEISTWVSAFSDTGVELLDDEIHVSPPASDEADDSEDEGAAATTTATSSASEEASTPAAPATTDENQDDVGEGEDNDNDNDNDDYEPNLGSLFD